jgi:hypothetical protein
LRNLEFIVLPACHVSSPQARRGEEKSLVVLLASKLCKCESLPFTPIPVYIIVSKSQIKMNQLNSLSAESEGRTGP